MATTPKKTDEPVPAEDLKTEKEKAPADPAGEAVEPEKSTPVDVPASEPYPTGSPPDAAEEFKKIHGYDKPK